MGLFSPFHFIFLAIIAALFGVPVWRILQRLGFNPAWILVCFIPLGALVGLWVLAFAQWPAIPSSQPYDRT